MTQKSLDELFPRRDKSMRKVLELLLVFTLQRKLENSESNSLIGDVVHLQHITDLKKASNVTVRVFM